MRQRNADRSKEQILQAAENAFAEKGFYGARVDEIADGANINKRMLYAYFGDKEALYKQVLFRVYARMEAVEKELTSYAYSGEQLIREIIKVYFAFLKTDKNFVRILMWENLNQGKYLQEMESDRIKRSTIQYFVSELEAGKAEGIFRMDMDPWHTALSLITICFANFSNQYTLSKLFGRNLADEELIEERRKYTTDMMLSYLCMKK